MAEQVRVDSEGNPQVDFVWGGMAPQPNAEREVSLDPKLGDHPIYDKGYSGYPGFKTVEVDNAPDVTEEKDVVEPGSARAVSEAGTLKLSGAGVTKSEDEVKKMADAKNARALASIAEQHGTDRVPDPLVGVETPDRSNDAKMAVTGDDVPTPMTGNTLTEAQERQRAAVEKTANDPVHKTVVMTPDEAIPAREAFGLAPQEGDLNVPVPPVTEQEKTGQDKVKENHNPDSEPGERVLHPELKGEVPTDQHPDLVAQTPAAENMPTASAEQQVPNVATGTGTKAPTAKIDEAQAEQIQVLGAGNPAVVDPATQRKDPAVNPAALSRQGIPANEVQAPTGSPEQSQEKPADAPEQAPQDPREIVQGQEQPQLQEQAPQQNQ